MESRLDEMESRLIINYPNRATENVLFHFYCALRVLRTTIRLLSVPNIVGQHVGQHSFGITASRPTVKQITVLRDNPRKSTSTPLDPLHRVYHEEHC